MSLLCIAPHTLQPVIIRSWSCLKRKLNSSVSTHKFYAVLNMVKWYSSSNFLFRQYIWKLFLIWIFNSISHRMHMCITDTTTKKSFSCSWWMKDNVEMKWYKIIWVPHFQNTRDAKELGLVAWGCWLNIWKMWLAPLNQYHHCRRTRHLNSVLV